MCNNSFNCQQREGTSVSLIYISHTSYKICVAQDALKLNILLFHPHERWVTGVKHTYSAHLLFLK